MRIGIDAKYYYSGGPSLISVVRNIVNKFIENNTEDEIVFFLIKKDVHFEEDFKMKIKGKTNMSYVFVPAKLNFFTNLLTFPFYFSKGKFDVILFQNYIPIWGRRKGTKYVAYVYDFLFLDYPQYFKLLDITLYRLMILTVKMADHVITISESERSRMIKHTKIQTVKISAVHPGLDDMFYERDAVVKENIKRKYNLPDKFVLYVGRLNIRKNIETVLKGFTLVKGDISLTIVGKEEKGGLDIDGEITRLGIKDKVSKIGHVPDADLAEILASAAVFVFPSHAEGFGLPPLEAMKSGVPAIVADNTSLPEVCGGAALLIRADDQQALAENIERLLSDHEVYAFYKKQGLERAKNFSWENSYQKIYTILKKTDSEG
jgi:glycosyltransferase involved in cell wall biosynthesis